MASDPKPVAGEGTTGSPPAVAPIAEPANEVPAAPEAPPPPPPTVAVRDPAFALDRAFGSERLGAERLGAEVDSGPEAGSQNTRSRDSRGPGNSAVWIGWVGTVVILILCVWAGYTFRSNVMHAWPASERLYTLLGLSAPTPP